MIGAKCVLIIDRPKLNVDLSYYSRWKDLFKLAAWSRWLFSISIVLALAAYIDQAYASGQMASEIPLIKLEDKPIGTLMSLSEIFVALKIFKSPLF